ncbi:hypothetical protein AADA15_03990 [Phycobacter sp. 'Weihai']
MAAAVRAGLEAPVPVDALVALVVDPERDVVGFAAGSDRRAAGLGAGAAVSGVSGFETVWVGGVAALAGVVCRTAA